MIKKSLALSIFLAFFTLANACDFHLCIDKRKNAYKPGEQLTVSVTLVNIHGNCSKSLTQVEFIPEKVKIKSISEWTKIDDDQWNCKIVLEVLPNAINSAKITAQRMCGKGGDEKSLTFKIANP
ncbi:MAG TPA: hypothetical protein PK990_03370 [Salinivirgaceae bacterium]|nr:hypothetical protein [Salinivirgaceae bacterium]